MSLGIAPEPARQLNGGVRRCNGIHAVFTCRYWRIFDWSPDVRCSETKHLGSGRSMDG